MIERWTRWVLHHRKTVLAVWIALFVIGGWAASGLADLLTNRFTLAGHGRRPRGERSSTITSGRSRRARSRSSRARTGTPPRSFRALRAAARCARRSELPTGRFVSVRAVSQHVATASIVSSLDPADAKGHTDDMRRAAGTIPGATALRHGAGGDRARPRPRLLARPQGRRAVHRDPDRVPAARSSSSGRSRSSCR